MSCGPTHYSTVVSKRLGRLGDSVHDVTGAHVEGVMVHAAFEASGATYAEWSAPYLICVETH